MQGDVVPVQENGNVEIGPLIERLRILLNNMGIKYIVSIDDEWGKEAVDLSKYTDSPLDQVLERRQIEIPSRENEIIEDEGITTVGDLIESKNPELESFKLLVDKSLGVNPNKPVFEALEGLMSRLDMKFLKVNSNSISKEIMSLEGKILFLLDMNMTIAGGKKDAVIDSLFEINKNRAMLFDLILVYSHENTLEKYQDHSTKKQYIKEYFNDKNYPSSLNLSFEEFVNILPYKLWGIRKTSILENLVTTLTKVLKEAALGQSMYEFFYEKLEIQRCAMLRLMQLTPETFEILYKEAFIEGELYIDVLEKAKSGIENKVEYEKFNNGKLKNIIENVINFSNYRTLKYCCEIGEKQLREETFQQKMKQQCFMGVSEHSLVDYSVNKIYRDVMPGDIFEIGLYEPIGELNTVYGVIIDANCDMPIRNYGDEIRRNINKIRLYLYENGNLNGAPSKRNQLKEGIIWPLLNNKTINQLKPLKQELYIDAKILDLCSLNKDGWGQIDIENKVLDFKTHHFRQYFDETLRPFVENVLKIETYLPKLEKTEYDKRLLEILTGLKWIVKVNIDQKKFELRRIGRLEAWRTSELARNIANKQSRVGTEIIPFIGSN